MLAATHGNDARDIAALQSLLAEASALRERDLLLTLIGSQTQLLRSALTLEWLRLESAKLDAQRETGYKQRDQALIEGTLKQAQRRYAPAVEKALLSALLTRYQQLPDAQHVPEFDAAFGRKQAQLQQALDKLYAGTKLGEEAERLSRFAAARAGKPVAVDLLMALAAALVPA